MEVGDEWNSGKNVIAWRRVDRIRVLEIVNDHKGLNI